MHYSITDKIMGQKKFNHSSFTSIYPKLTKIYVAQVFCLIVFISAMNRAFLVVLYHKQQCSVYKKISVPYDILLLVPAGHLQILSL